MPRHNNVQFDIAEVISTATAYQYSKSIAGNGLFKFRARSATQHTKVREYDVKPMNLSNLKMPVIGEIILVCQTINNLRDQTRGEHKHAWYYVCTLDLQSGINNNKSTGITYTTAEKERIDPQTYPSGKTFNDQKIISPLQPFEGDILWQSRYGSSIRFGSTISTMPEEYYYKSPNWLGDTDSDPIIILANGQKNLEQKEFVVEDINQDNSSLYLTSTQKIPLEFIQPPNNVNNFEGSNFIGTADRVILKSKKDRVIIDGGKDILLNTTGSVKIGGDTNMTPIPEGDQFVNVLNKIAQILAKGNLVQGSIASPIATTSLVELNSMIEKIKSKNYLIKKNS